MKKMGEYELEYLVWFAHMPQEISCGCDNCMDTKSTNGLCLLTSLRRQLHPLNAWAPAFWRVPDLPCTVIKALTADIVDPVFWVMGEYLSPDFPELINRGLIPTGITLPKPPPRKMVSVGLILRTQEISDIVFPWEQGFGHMPGARIAVFSSSTEPITIYDEWLHSARTSTDFRYKMMLSSDNIFPKDASVWMSPYGEEDREHALISKKRMCQGDLVKLVADSIGIPLMLTHSTREEFLAWEDYHVLPKDLRHAMEVTSD